MDTQTILDGLRLDQTAYFPRAEGSRVRYRVYSSPEVYQLEFTRLDDSTFAMQSNYVVVQTRTDGESRIYQAVRYFDRVVRTAAGWRYQSKRADTSRVQTLLITPV